MMQPGQSAHRQAHLADQAARQAQLQVRLGHQQAEQGRYRRRQQQARRSGSRMASAAGQGSTRPAQVPARRRTGKLAGWGVAVSVVFWAIAIAKHVEWVMQHDSGFALARRGGVSSGCRAAACPVGAEQTPHAGERRRLGSSGRP